MNTEYKNLLNSKFYLLSSALLDFNRDKNVDFIRFLSDLATRFRVPVFGERAKRTGVGSFYRFFCQVSLGGVQVTLDRKGLVS